MSDPGDPTPSPDPEPGGMPGPGAPGPGIPGPGPSDPDPGPPVATSPSSASEPSPVSEPSSVSEPSPGATLTVERPEVDAGRIEAELAAVDDALVRLDEGRYGRCAACGAAIEDDRLATDPTVDRCAQHRSSAAAPRW